MNPFAAYGVVVSEDMLHHVVAKGVLRKQQRMVCNLGEQLLL